MTISEFHAWLEGFSESFTEAPNAEQWAKIKAKLASLEALRVPTANEVRRNLPIGTTIGWPLPAPSTCSTLEGRRVNEAVWTSRGDAGH